MHVSLRRENYNARRGWDAFSGVLLIFDKHFSNYIQIPSKYSNIMLSIYEISRSILGADEDGRMQFVTSCCFTFSNGIEKSHNFLTKISNFVQFNHKNHCCNVN